MISIRCIRIVCIVLLGWVTMLVPVYSSEGSFSGQDSIAQEIYVRLQEAIGDKRAQWPRLRVWSVENRGAIFVQGENSIYLDEKLIASCQTFGDQMRDALSFVIAHEMTHFYQSHHWKESGLLGNFLVSAEAFEANREHEAQADIYGAFVSYQAGYNTLGLIPSLLDQIYSAYNLDSNANSRYPSLEARKQLALEACDFAGNLIEIYQVANYLLVLGKFEEAYQLYKYVEKSIQFKELHYNIGICNMQAYLYLKKIYLKYPFSLDSKTPILRGLMDRSPDMVLNEASESFELITKKYDSNYEPAGIHLISIYDWMEEPKKAVSTIQQYDGITKVVNSNLYLLTKANFYSRNGNARAAIDIYRSILSSQAPGSNFIKDVTSYNLGIVQSRVPHPSLPKNYLIQNEKDLDGVKSLVFYRDFQHDVHLTSSLQYSYGQEYNSIVSKLSFGKSRFTMQRVTSSGVKLSCGLGIGNSLPDIEDQFPPEQRTYGQHLDGSYIIIFEKGLIFKLNQEGIVQEWVSFSI